MGHAPTVGTNVFYGAPNVTVYYIEGKLRWPFSFARRPTALWFIPPLSSDGAGQHSGVASEAVTFRNSAY